MTQRQPLAAHSLVLLIALSLAACQSAKPPASSAAPASDLAMGRQLFEEPHVDANTFTCATCHALAEPSPDGLRRPGHPLGDATRRARWKNGQSSTFLAAVNSCLEEWMVAPPWQQDDAGFLALRAFLDAQAPRAPVRDLSFEIVAPPAVVSGGDAERGRALFDRTCIVCHGAGGTGSERGPRVAPSARSGEYMAKRIRTSGSKSSSVYSDLTGGVMPFWAKDRLSDDEVRDLVAFMLHAPAGTPAPPTAPAEPGAIADGGSIADGGPDRADAGIDTPAASAGDASVRDLPVPSVDVRPDGGAGCGKSHARIGWRADLGVNTGEGEVSGLVTMIDDCTLELSNFSYNGDGIEVRVFGAKVKNFRPGFTIGPDLVGRKFVRSTLRVPLPPGKSLDDLDFVSIWCVRARADFGSGPFLPPSARP